MESIDGRPLRVHSGIVGPRTCDGALRIIPSPEQEDPRSLNFDRRGGPQRTSPLSESNDVHVPSLSGAHAASVRLLCRNSITETEEEQATPRPFHRLPAGPRRRPARNNQNEMSFHRSSNNVGTCSMTTNTRGKQPRSHC